MFVASKVLWFLFQPSSLMLAVLAYGLFRIARGATRQGLAWSVLAVITLAFAGLSALGDYLIAPLENRFQRPTLDGARIDGILVLGGAESGVGGTRELLSLNEAGERLTEAMMLARRFPTARLAFTGGSSALFGDGVSQTAARVGALFAALGLPADRVVIENASRNTHENAVYAQALLKPQPGETWLLVTSAAHMPRSMGIFRRVGWNLQPWPVDYRAPSPLDATRTSQNIGEGLQRLDAVFREYAGLVAYRMLGRTDALFPGP